MKNVRFFFLLLFFIAFLQCTKETIIIREYPRLGHTTITRIYPGGLNIEAALITLGNTPILDHGFIWSNFINPTLASSEILSLGTQLSKGKFGGVVDRAMRAKVPYYIRPFVKTTQFVVYGEELEFTSLGSHAPSIEKITPDRVFWGDTVMISGKNFSLKQTSVKIANEKSVVLSSTDTLLKVIIPSGITVLRPEVSVEVAGIVGTSTSHLTMKPHIIERFEPISGTLNDTITVYGKFHYTKPEIFLGDKNCSVINFSQNTLSFRVPSGVPKGENLLKIANGEITSTPSQKFIRTAPEIKIIMPNEVGYRDTVTIIGKYFGLQSYSNQVTIAGYGAEIISVKKDTLKVSMPWGPYASSLPTVEIRYNEQAATISNALIIKPPSITSITAPDIVYPGQSITVNGNNFGRFYGEANPGNSITLDGTVPQISISGIKNLTIKLSVLTQNNEPLIKITSAGNSAELKASFKSPYKKINSFPYSNGITKATTFSIGSNGYVITGFNSDNYSPNKKFCRFSQTTMEWQSLPDFPGTARYDAFAIEFQGKGYLLGGRSLNRPLVDFWVYDEQQNMWTEKGIAPFHAIGGAVINNELYILSNEQYSLDSKGNVVGFGGIAGVFKYNLINNSWEQLLTPPFTSDQDKRFYFELNNNLYAGTLTGFYDYNLYKFSPNDQTWTLLGTTPFTAAGAPVSFAVNGNAYLIDRNGFYKYMPVSNSWLKLFSEPGVIWGEGRLSVFKIGTKVYTGLGQSNGPYYYIPMYAGFNDIFLEFTPLE